MLHENRIAWMASFLLIAMSSFQAEALALYADKEPQSEEIADRVLVELRKIENPKADGVEFFIHGTPLMEFAVCSHLEEGPVVDSMSDHGRENNWKDLPPSKRNLLYKCRSIANNIAIIHWMVMSRKKDLKSGKKDDQYNDAKSMRRLFLIYIDVFVEAIEVEDNALLGNLFSWLMERPLSVTLDGEFCRVVDDALTSTFDNRDTQKATLQKSQRGRKFLSYLFAVRDGCEVLWNFSVSSKLRKLKKEYLYQITGTNLKTLISSHFIRKGSVKLISKIASKSNDADLKLLARTLSLCVSEQAFSSESGLEVEGKAPSGLFIKEDEGLRRMFGLSQSSKAIVLHFFIDPALRASLQNTEGGNIQVPNDRKVDWEMWQCKIRMGRK